MQIGDSFDQTFSGQEPIRETEEDYKLNQTKMHSRRDLFGYSAIVLCVILFASVCSASAEDAVAVNSESNFQGRVKKV